MMIIGEKINVLNTTVYESVISAELSSIVDLAVLQVKSGADVLDINLGPDISNGRNIMKELVKAIQQKVDVPLCLNGSPEIIESGLMVHKGRAIINGITGDRERMERLLSLAHEFNARIIGMTVTEKGFAEELDNKCMKAMEIIKQAARYGISISDIYMDPLLSPFTLNPDAVIKAVENIRAFKEMFPEVKTIVALSNISQGINTKNRSVINNTALGVMIGAGLDAAILNPLDRVVMETVKTEKLLCNSGIYCDAYLCA